MTGDGGSGGAYDYPRPWHQRVIDIVMALGVLTIAVTYYLVAKVWEWIFGETKSKERP